MGDLDDDDVGVYRKHSVQGPANHHLPEPRAGGVGYRESGRDVDERTLGLGLTAGVGAGGVAHIRVFARAQVR